jgi:Ceramidase
MKNSNTMPFQIFKKLSLQSLAITFAMLFVWILLNSIFTGSVWEGMEISKSALTVEYCEFNNTQKFFHQSMNTYSNLVYFFFGIFICLIAKQDADNQDFTPKNRLGNFPELSFLIGISFIYLSFGSAFFHASLTWVGQRVDMNGTYSLSISIVLIALYEVFYKIEFSENAKRNLIVLVLILIVAFYKIALLIPSSILLPIFILSAWLLMAINYFQFRKKRSLTLALLSIISIVIALKIRAMDIQKINCDPHSFYQGHSLWHFLAGFSSFCSYTFFRFK